MVSGRNVDEQFLDSNVRTGFGHPEDPMKWQDCLKAFVLAFFGGALAGISFSLISSKLLAGAIAGLGFLIVGAFCLKMSLKAQKPWMWVTFYTALIHLFGISIPMIVFRWMDPEVPFAQLNVWGIPGHQFHFYSTNFYYTLMLGLVLDGIRAWWKQKSQYKKPV